MIFIYRLFIGLLNEDKIIADIVDNESDAGSKFADEPKVSPN